MNFNSGIWSAVSPSPFPSAKAMLLPVTSCLFHFYVYVCLQLFMHACEHDHTCSSNGLKCPVLGHLDQQNMIAAVLSKIIKNLSVRFFVHSIWQWRCMNIHHDRGFLSIALFYRPFFITLMFPPRPRFLCFWTLPTPRHPYILMCAAICAFKMWPSHIAARCFIEIICRWQYPEGKLVGVKRGNRGVGWRS